MSLYDLNSNLLYMKSCFSKKTRLIKALPFLNNYSFLPNDVLSIKLSNKEVKIEKGK